MEDDCPISDVQTDDCALSEVLYQNQTLTKEYAVEDDSPISDAVQTDDCAISEVLYQKYAHVEQHDDSLNHSAKSLPSTSFHASLTFTESDSIQNAFQRSFNLTKVSPTHSLLNVDHSFKSPLSRKSNSFTDKRALRSLTRKSISFTDKLALSPLSCKSDSLTLDKPDIICTSPFSHSDASIDLTQDDEDADDADEGVLLSDDEINYSIWKADKTFRGKDEDERLDKSSSSSSDVNFVSPLTKKKTMPYFKTLEDLDAYLDTPSPVVSTKSSESRSPNKSVLSKERAEFGILDAALSQPFTLSQPPSLPTTEPPQVPIDWSEVSFLDSPTELPLKRFSSIGNQKFNELLNMPTTESIPVNDDDNFDEFDRLVMEKKNDSSTSSTNTLPSGMDRLLMGEINLDTLSEPSAPEIPISTEPDQLEVNGQVYTVRICDEPKPDFISLSETELLQHLYKYGIKPLKRHQAVKLLEFIYNQTHPIMMPLEESKKKENQQQLVRSKSTPVVTSSQVGKPRAPLLQMASTDCLTPTEADKPKTEVYKFKDASGVDLLRFSQAVPPDLCDPFEFYVVQTNVTKKTPQPLLPLHIAWHNLLCANPQLHESVLMFEPIDLQEIYMHFKQMGHRYDPKELKLFFDRRCIIFRYELAPPTNQAQRHVRKQPRKKPRSKF